MAVLFISYALEEVSAVSARIKVLRDGKLVETDLTEKLDRDRIGRAMVDSMPTEELRDK